MIERVLAGGRFRASDVTDKAYGLNPVKYIPVVRRVAGRTVVGRLVVMER